VQGELGLVLIGERAGTLHRNASAITGN